jgi:hypothetical protein
VTASKPCPLVFRPDDLQVSALSHGRRASVGVRGADEGLACTDDALDVHTLAGQDRHAQPGLGVVALGGGEVTPGELGVGEPAELEVDVGHHGRGRCLCAPEQHLAHLPEATEEGGPTCELQASAEQSAAAQCRLSRSFGFDHGGQRSQDGFPAGFSSVNGSYRVAPTTATTSTTTSLAGPALGLPAAACGGFRAWPFVALSWRRGIAV